jgi:hypothetical protein
MRWKPDEIEKLKEMLLQGDTCEHVAQVLGRTRTSVNVQASRLKLTNQSLGVATEPLPFDPTDSRVRNLESRVKIMKNENSIQKQELDYYRERAALFDGVVEAVKEEIKPFSALPSCIPVDIKNRTHVEDVVMHQSDEHMADIVDPKSVQGLEDYNFKVACCRAENYVNKVLEITQQTLTGYRFPNLWILRYGDHSSGEIHNAVLQSEFKNQFKNSFAISQVHALMVRDLAPYFEHVFVVCLPGNHGRRSKKKDYHSPHDNWDYAISKVSAMLNSEIKNVTYLIPNAFSTVLNIQGFNFAIEHGDDVKSWNSIPYYGLERKTRRLLALNATQGIKIDYFVFGHFHQPTTMNQLGSVETIINGAWKATDPYTFGSLSGYVTPSQWLHGVHPEHGISWRFKIKLKGENELKGPVRYKVEM